MACGKRSRGGMIMWKRLALIPALVLAPVFIVSAQVQLHEEGQVGEPWSGWWWPRYHASGCSYPHLWSGPGYDPSTPGPMYDFSTKYFWLPAAKRTLAQNWEVQHHHTTDPNLAWGGHCLGVSCAQSAERNPDPLPVDNGALSQDDLEGLLGETWMSPGLHLLVDNGPDPVLPSDLWNWALRACLHSQSPIRQSFVMDFCSDLDAYGHDKMWFWPVYGYDIDVTILSGIAVGQMRLKYEDHVYGVGYAHDEAWYEFWCPVTMVQSPQGPVWVPEPHSGGWIESHGPGGLSTPPDVAYMPMQRSSEISGSDGANPYIDYDTLKRVIDHRLIVMDDPYCYSMDSPPGGGWLRRPGFAESCWAAPTYEVQWPIFAITWHPRLGVSGVWRFEVYKTHPWGSDKLNVNADCYFWGLGPNEAYYNQNEAPFDTWVPLGPTVQLDQGEICLWISSFIGEGSPCLTYMDAFEAIYVGPAPGEGCQSASSGRADVRVYRTSVTPNPAVSTARINYLVKDPCRVDIDVYDVMGRVVLKLPQGMKRAGVQAATISVAGLATGTYIAMVTANGEHSTCRFVVSR